MPNITREEKSTTTYHARPQAETAAPPQPALPARGGMKYAALLWQAAAAAVGFVMGAGQVYGGAAPFGLAMVIGCLPGYALAGAAGAMAGGLVFLPIEQAVKLAGAVLAALVGRKLGRGQLWVSAAAGCSALILTEAAVGFGLGGGMNLSFNAAESAAILCTAVLGAALGAAIQAMPSDKPRGIGLWLAMLVACTQSFTLYGFAPGLAIFALAGLCAAYAGSLEQSAVLAVVLAAAFTAASPSLCYAALAVALGVLGASALCGGERWRCAGVFLLGCGLGALAAPDFTGAITLLAGAGCGLLVFLLMPATLLRAVFPPPAPPAAAQGLTGAARRLTNVADTLSDIAETVNAVCERQLPPKGETYDFVVDFAARQVCQQCARREKCWIRGYSLAVDGLYAMKTTLENDGSVNPDKMPGQLATCVRPSDLCGAVNRGYRLWRSRRQSRARASVLRSALTEQYSAMATALAQLATRIGQTGLPDPRKEARVAQLFSSIGLDALECSVTGDVAGRTCASVTVARTAFSPDELRTLTREVSRICRHDFSSPDVTNCRTVTMLSFGERPLYRPIFGVASRPAEQISGDATDYFCDAAGRAQLFLCDGMGTGKAAAVDGKLAARLTGQLLRAGFAAESAARLVNVAMGLKNGDQESGATLDLLTVDLFTGRAGLFKAGAAPSFLLREGVPRMMEGASLPMGILDSVVGRSSSFGLCVGDTVVLVSDGVLCDGTAWIMQQLQLCGKLGHTPAQLADVLADSAVRRAPGRRDDVTVIALRLERS